MALAKWPTVSEAEHIARFNVKNVFGVHRSLDPVYNLLRMLIIFILQHYPKLTFRIVQN